MRRDDDHTLLLMAAAAAFVTSFVAVAQHVRLSAVGYEIDRAEKRQVELTRALSGRRGRVAALGAPAALIERAGAMGLSLDYPTAGATAREPGW